MSDFPGTVSRRKALALIGTGGALLAQSASQAFAKDSPLPPTGSSATLLRYPTVAALKTAKALTEGQYAETAGYFTPGDGGGSIYLVEKPAAEPEDTAAARVSLDNGLMAKLVESEAVNYRMFGAVGDGEQDDGVQIKQAHEYAVRHDLPIINLSGEFWIKETTEIPITTSVHWGKTIFHIDERFNDRRRPRFRVENDHPSQTLELDPETKEAVLAQLKPGVQIIPELAPYAGCLISVVDKDDEIGIRAGSNYTGRGWAREELFYVEREGRIIGDIAWEFKNYTSLIATPCNDNYLVIEGGGFYLSGDDPADEHDNYYHNGFLIERSRTIVRQQWMGLEKGKRDVALRPRRGFYILSRVFDVTLEDIRAIPWEHKRPDPAKVVGAGTYGIGGKRMLNCTFRNLTAEAGPVAWGVFGTNLNKNFRLENCRLNRVDVHFHCWNLYISNCTIGFKGITVTGGGDLVVENTTRHGNHFINFRRDYGAKWDGHIRLLNCTLKPNDNGVVSVLYQRMADFDYQYPIGHARTIKVTDLVIDFSAAPESKAECWLINTVPFSKTKDGDRLFFPYAAEFRNITVEGREQGVRLLHLPDPYHYDVPREGGYDGTRLLANSTFTFDNVQLEKLPLRDPEDPERVHLRLGGSPSSEYEDAHAFYPRIRFANCNNLNLHLAHCIAAVSFEHCAINTVHAPGLRGELLFNDCRIQPDVQQEPANFWTVESTLGTRFTNCTVHAPVIGGKIIPEKVNKIGFLTINETLRHYHLNTGLGNEILNYLESQGTKFAPEFIAKLKAHHALED